MRCDIERAYQILRKIKMPIRLQPGFFDIHERTAKLTEMGDPLVGLDKLIDWESFRPGLNVVHEKPRKSTAGAKPIDVVLMFKLLVLQRLNNLSDDRIEYQIRDRLSFMRFLGLQYCPRIEKQIRRDLVGRPVIKQMAARRLP